MGWLWSSTPPSEDKSPAPAKETPPATSTTPLSPSTSTSTPSNSNTDPEIQKFLDLFEAEKNSNPSSTQEQQQQQKSSAIPSWLSLKKSTRSSALTPADIPPRDALSEALLPTDMSCRQAFDQAWACNSMGGQFNAVYRYGEMRSCSEHWDDFWFCMRTKSYSAEMREKAIRDYYRAKEFTKYGPGKPSSEDVWESREGKVPEGTVFNEPIE
ncbi:Early meiotic induction protein 1 [Fusarium austroafricanum]|uniref:Early meiotic induction protein 1 n=1 Tax=Fusarium austroafricanum TaxID=2364996 RepID=A0A8H4KQU5_9HYPO|nr:Early meiotic induction protein 1 [Fusarium austroafricanum]